MSLASNNICIRSLHLRSRHRGLRRRSKIEEKLEKLSVMDTLRAIDFAEVVVLLLDATRGLEVQDLKIADRVLQEGRALIIAPSPGALRSARRVAP